LLGLDPAYRKFGWCVARLGRNALHYEAFGLIRNHKDLAPNASVARKNLEGVQFITRELNQILAEWSGIRAVFPEAPAGSQSARSASLLGLAWGAVGSWAETHELPVYEITPQRLKIVMCGKQSASKQEVADAFVEASRLPESVHGMILKIAKTHREHMYDAGAAIWAQRHSQGFLSVKRLCGV